MKTRQEELPAEKDYQWLCHHSITGRRHRLRTVSSSVRRRMIRHWSLYPTKTRIAEFCTLQRDHAEAHGIVRSHAGSFGNTRMNTQTHGTYADTRGHTEATYTHADTHGSSRRLTEHYVGFSGDKRKLYIHHSYHVAIRGTIDHP
jgi:hypothetical protein